jgi:type IV secretory pathway VirB3-like protein
MNFLSSLFVRAKHWQIFLLGNGLCYAALFIEYLLVGERSLPTLGEYRLTLLGIASGLSMFGFLSWFWCVGYFLYAIVKPELRPKAGFFGVALAYPVLYGFAVPTLFVSSNPALAAVLLPLHLFAMICLIYDLYFVSRSLALAETGTPKVFSDFAGTFFLLCFFPIGVWIVQPKVNRYMGPRETALFGKVIEGLSLIYLTDCDKP